MPTAIHESFSEQVLKETKAQLDRIGSGNDEAARFAAQISSDPEAYSYESLTRTTTSK
jgi:hypothetical protein